MKTYTGKYVIGYSKNGKTIYDRDDKYVYYRCNNCNKQGRNCKQQATSIFKQDCICYRTKYYVGYIQGDKKIIGFTNNRKTHITICLLCGKETRGNVTDTCCICKIIKYHIGEIYNGRELIKFNKDQYTLKCIYCGKEARGSLGELKKYSCKCRHASAKHKIGEVIKERMIIGISNGTYQMKCMHCGTISNVGANSIGNCRCNMGKLKYKNKTVKQISRETGVPMVILLNRHRIGIDLYAPYYKACIRYRYKGKTIMQWAKDLGIKESAIRNRMNRGRTLEEAILFSK